MGVLTLYDTSGQSVLTDTRMVQHEGLRAAVATSYTGTISAGAVVTFSNGSIGKVYAFSTSTHVLQFFLTSPPSLEHLRSGVELPAGLNATTSGGTLSGLRDFTAYGDSYTNDPRSHLYVSNASGSDLYVIAVARGRCNHKGYHHDAVMVPSGYAGPLRGWSDLQRFTDPATGRVTVVYSGTGSPADLGVMAVIL